MATTADADPEVGPAPRDPAQRRLGWVGLGVAAMAFLVAILSGSILSLTWLTVRGLSQDEAPRDLGFSTFFSLGLWVGFLALPVLWSLLAGGPGRVLGLRARWADLPLGLAAGLGSSVVTAVVSSIVLTSAQTEALEAKARETVDRASGPAALTLLVLVLCVGTPIAEEVFFRGLLFRSLHRAVGVAVAVPVAGVLFGLAHYDFKAAPAAVVAVQLGLLSLFGVVLCALVHRTGRLAAGVVAHAAFNGATVVSLLLER